MSSMDSAVAGPLTSLRSAAPRPLLVAMNERQPRAAAATDSAIAFCSESVAGTRMLSLRAVTGGTTVMMMNERCQMQPLASRTVFVADHDWVLITGRVLATDCV